MIGQMAPCKLWKDKMKWIRKYDIRIQDTDTKMKAFNITTKEGQLNFIRSCMGQELTEFWEKEVRIQVVD